MLLFFYSEIIFKAVYSDGFGLFYHFNFLSKDRCAAPRLQLLVVRGEENKSGLAFEAVTRVLYRSRTRKPNALLKRCFWAHFFPSQISPEFGFLVMKHKKEECLEAWRKIHADLVFQIQVKG